MKLFGKSCKLCGVFAESDYGLLHFVCQHMPRIVGVVVRHRGVDKLRRVVAVIRLVSYCACLGILLHVCTVQALGIAHLKQAPVYPVIEEISSQSAIQMYMRSILFLLPHVLAVLLQ